ncbi:MAG TPA: galactokinase family protein [bacterium]
MSTISDITQMLNARRFESVLSNLYENNPQTLDRQRQRYQRIINSYSRLFPDGDIQFFSTPGRTEIGGNHTDHNHGRVLAASVNLDSIAAAAPIADPIVTIYSEAYSGAFQVELADLKPRPQEEGGTAALVRGIAARCKELGFEIGGFNACVTSDVLVGSGLSSSASIEVLIGSIFNHLYNDGRVPPETLALIGQFAENEYFNKPCGLMDQLTCAVGGIVTIDFNDPQQPVFEKVEFDFRAQNYSLLVVNTGGSHADLIEDYASIPREMRAVAEALGKKVGREIVREELLAQLPTVRPRVGDRAILRIFHFLADNDRVVDQVAALKLGDFQRFLQLVTESGNSSSRWLQNCYTTKAPQEQGINLALALTENYINKHGAGACRVHGGGFAGTIQVFLPNSILADYVKQLEGVFGKGSVLILQIRPHGTTYINSFSAK